MTHGQEPEGGAQLQGCGVDGMPGKDCSPLCGPCGHESECSGGHLLNHLSEAPHSNQNLEVISKKIASFLILRLTEEANVPLYPHSHCSPP